MTKYKLSQLVEFSDILDDSSRDSLSLLYNSVKIKDI